MEGQWHTDFDTAPQYQSTDEAPPHWPPRQRQPKGRSSLGQLIERSTSAPPLSSTPEDYNKASSLVGPGLLEQIPRGAEEGVILQQSILGGMEEQFGGGKLFDSVDSNSGRSTAPTTMSYSDYLMTGGFMDSSSRPESTGVHSHADDLYRDFASLGINKLDGMGLTRSQSAAPMIPGRNATIGPPPGLPSHQQRSEHNEEDDMVSPLHHHHHAGQRSSSADFVRGHHMTLRPSAKTLMDLIQEDHPEDRVRNNVHHYGDQDHRNASGIASRGHGGYLGKPEYMENNKRTEPFMSYEQTGNVMMNGAMERAIPAGMSQRELMEQQLYRNHQSLMPPRHNVSPPHIATQATNMELQHPQQPAYYRGAHPLPMQSQQQQGMQAQVLSSNHQGVYIRAAPPPPPAPEHHRYAYATVQYPPNTHAPVQQGINYHQGTVAADHHQQQQFVSIVPVHGGPAAQIAYWQTADGRPSSGATVAIVNAPMPGSGTTGAPMTMARIGTTSIQEPPNGQYARPRGVGGGGSSGGIDKTSRGKRGQTRRGNDAKHVGGTSSSPLLEQFRATKNRDWTIRQIEGHVVEFCQDQNGSRFIQQRLEVGDAVEQQIVMTEVLPSIRRLRNDVFGNYVVQKLLDFGSEKIKEDIRSTLEGEMVQLSLQMYGCRVVQKAIETLNDDDLARLLLEFHHNVLSCIHDQNGNHVIQKCIEVVCTRGKQAAATSIDEESRVLEKIDFVVNDVLHNTATLSCHPYGCRVLQRILEHCDHVRKTAVLDQVCKCHRKLLDDQYGNYVIQHVLQFGRQSDRDSILVIIQENGLLELSRQKFASNVVEKLLKYGNDEQRLAVVREMLKPAPDTAIVLDTSGKTRSVVLLMVRDAYANYVVQTTLDVIPESEEKRMLLNELNSHSEELRNYTFAKHIVSKLATMNDS